MEEKNLRHISDPYDAYTNIRFKSYDQGVMWLEDNVELMSLCFGYDKSELTDIIARLEAQVTDMAKIVTHTYQKEMDQVLSDKKFTFAIVGCSFSSEYLSYFNVIKRVLEPYRGIRIIDAAVTAETVPQTIMHIYNRALHYQPDITSLFMGVNDMRRNNDVYSKNNVSPDEFYRDINYLVKVLTQGGKDVILNTITPSNLMVLQNSIRDKNWTYHVDDWDTFNGILRKLADINGCVLNDQALALDTQFHGTINIPENGLHLTREAQEFLALQFMRVFLETVKLRFQNK